MTIHINRQKKGTVGLQKSIVLPSSYIIGTDTLVI